MTVYNVIIRLTQIYIWQNTLQSFMKWRHQIIMSQFYYLVGKNWFGNTMVYC